MGYNYHRQTSSSSSFFLRLVGEDVGVTFSFLIGLDDEGLTSDFFSFLTITGFMEFDFF